MDEREFKVLCKHSFFIGKSANQTEEWLKKCYTNIENTSIPSNNQICDWYEEFEAADIAEPIKTDKGERSTDDGNNVLTNQNCRKRTIKAPPSNSCLCDVCGKVFSRTDALKHHRRIHSDTKAFTCRTCGKQFHDRSNLRVRLPNLLFIC